MLYELLYDLKNQSVVEYDKNFMINANMINANFRSTCTANRYICHNPFNSGKNNRQQAKLKPFADIAVSDTSKL